MLGGFTLVRMGSDLLIPFCGASLWRRIDLTESLLRSKHNVLQDPSKGRDFQGKHGLYRNEKTTLQSFAQSCSLKKALNTPKEPLRHCSCGSKQKAESRLGNRLKLYHIISRPIFKLCQHQCYSCYSRSRCSRATLRESPILSATNLCCGCACVFTS